MKPVIIGIHGLGNKPPRKLLKKWWLKSIHEGLEKTGKDRLSIPFDLVYWADVIHPVPLNPFIRNKEHLLYIDEKYGKSVPGKIDEKPSVKARMLKYLEEQLDKLFLNDDMSINFKNVTDKLIHRYFLDLETYYGRNCMSVIESKCSVREVIQRRLLEKLKEYKDYKILLIAHSMGSIVSFDVLSNLQPGMSVHTFITIGSPLGFPVIVGQIFAEQKEKNRKLKKPHAPDSISGKWLNLSDFEDKVALDHTLADDYGKNSKGLIAEDILVYNDYEMNGLQNPHKSYGYLRTPELADVINEFLISRRTDRIYRGYKYSIKKVVSGIHHIKNVFKR
ncbi:hypothetical protein ACFL4T_02165 [candidate division KSB1 bacterium]